jgi:hypothetical protein
VAGEPGMEGPAEDPTCEDGIDNDCDGDTDGDDPDCQGCTDNDGDGVGIDDGVCVAPFDCDDADPNNYPGNTESCDDQDNNCNDLVDEDFPDKGDSCTAGTGACETTGTIVCTADGLATECDAVPGEPGMEGPAGDATCEDGIDNDCDGDTDGEDPDCQGVKEVSLDIKPGSCPNPFRLKCIGLLPAAVLGSDELDVTTIDPETIMITREGIMGGVPAFKISYKDVGTPFEGELCDCHGLYGDGYMDLSLKFIVADLITGLMLDEFGDRETIPLTIVGETYDGTPIRGEDCIQIIGTLKKECR